MVGERGQLRASYTFHKDTDSSARPSLSDRTKSRLAVVSCEAKKKQHACTSSGLSDCYSELFTRMAALKFKNAVTQPLQQYCLLNY